jgi:hypothetical protein
MDPSDSLSDSIRINDGEIEMQMFKEGYTCQELSPFPDINLPRNTTT